MKAIQAQIDSAKKLWKELCQKEEEIQRRYDLALSVPGVGKETARVIACELPANLEKYRVDQLCAYAGVVPRRDQSGVRQAPEQVGKRGNAHLRTGAFMASTRTVFVSKANEERYLALRAKGKTHKQAMVAILHRLLREVFTVIKRGTPWQSEPPKVKKERGCLKRGSLFCI